MDKSYHAKAIVLKREPFRERDSRISAYSDRYGLLELVVRGTGRIGSKLAGHIEPFNRIDLMAVKGRKWEYLAAAAAREVFPRLKSRPDDIAFAGGFFSLILRLVRPGISDRPIYGLILEYLRPADRPAPPAAPAYLSAAAKLKLLSRLGYQPVLDRCAVCGVREGADTFRFFPDAGGLLCPRHQSGAYSFAPGAAALSFLAQALGRPLGDIAGLTMSRQTEAECAKAVDAFCCYHF